MDMGNTVIDGDRGEEGSCIKRDHFVIRTELEGFDSVDKFKGILAYERAFYEYF